MGKEGRQAVNNSDYAIGQFRRAPWPFSPPAISWQHQLWSNVLFPPPGRGAGPVARLNCPPRSQLRTIRCRPSAQPARCAAARAGIPLRPSYHLCCAQQLSQASGHRRCGASHGFSRLLWLSDHRGPPHGAAAGDWDRARGGMCSASGGRRCRFLARLLLVHGTLSHYRLARLIRYSFLKNIVFCFMLFFYQFYCAFSGRPPHPTHTPTYRTPPAAATRPHARTRTCTHALCCVKAPGPP